MSKTFNVSGACNPDRHFVVDLESRLREIKSMIDCGSISLSAERGNMERLLCCVLLPDI